MSLHDAYKMEVCGFGRSLNGFWSMASATTPLHFLK